MKHLRLTILVLLMACGGMLVASTASAGASKDGRDVVVVDSGGFGVGGTAEPRV